MENEFKWYFSSHPSDVNLESDDPMVDYLIITINELLNYVVFTKNGKEVEIDGFKFIKDRYSDNSNFLLADLKRGMSNE